MTTTVFRAARVFDGTDFLPGPHDVTVDGDLITSIVPTGAGPVAVHGDVDVVGCAGKTLVPGFIDSHVHLLMSGSPMAIAMRPYSQVFYESAYNARTVLASGVTSVRDAGGADLGMKRAVDLGLIPGPRMKIATSVVSQTGGHGDGRQPSGYTFGLVPEHEGLPHAIADGVDEARKVARSLFRAGADHIKICTSGGVLSPSDDPRHPQFTYDEIRVFVEEAEAVGSYVLAHAIGAAGIKNAVRAGVRSIEHGIFADDEIIQMMLDKDVFLVPTLTAPRSVIKNAEAGVRVPPYMLDKARAVVDRHLESFSRAYKAGVRIAMGSDAGVGAHGHGLDELPLMAEGGMTLEETLSAATKVPAELIGESGRVGEIREGLLADLVLIDAELTSTGQLSALPSSIAEVYKGGVAVRGGARRP